MDAELVVHVLDPHLCFTELFLELGSVVLPGSLLPRQFCDSGSLLIQSLVGLLQRSLQTAHLLLKISALSFERCQPCYLGHQIALCFIPASSFLPEISTQQDRK